MSLARHWCKSDHFGIKLHPKNLISRAYANYTKTDKVAGLVVVSKGPKLICCEEKVVIISCHPPKGDLTEEFDCWAIHCFAHVTEEGDEEQLFTALNDGGDNDAGRVGVTHPNPNIMQNTKHNNNVEEQTGEVVPVEIAPLLESNSLTLDSDDAYVVQQILPGMVDNDNQPLPENIPTLAKEGQDAPQFCSTWEHSGSCYCCIAGGCKHKAHLSFNTDVKPTIQQLFELFFFKSYVVGIIIPQTNIHLKEEKHLPVSYGEFLHWFGLWFLMVTINGPECMEFWSMGEVDCFVGAPMRLITSMSRKWFNTILKALGITARQPPAFSDCLTTSLYGSPVLVVLSS